VVTDAELVKSGGEVDGVSREEVSVDAVECAINLHTIWSMNLVVIFMADSELHAPER